MEKLRFNQNIPVFIIGNKQYMIFDEYDVKGKIPEKEKVGQLLIFAVDGNSLDNYFLSCVDKITEDCVLWIAYPKKSGKIKSDITRDNAWEVVTRNGYDPVTQVALNDDWSALRFKRTAAIKTKLRDVPMQERKDEGIDYVNRTVELPEDAKWALKDAGLLAVFDKFSFSHKKEYVLSIIEAKKQETRERRIEKMIAALQSIKQKAK